MIDTDLTAYTTLIDELRKEYGKPVQSSQMTLIDFQELRQYSIDQIYTAVGRHRASEKGDFYPSPGSLIKHLEGGEITGDMIVAAANLKNTPLGCLALIHIGGWDLGNKGGMAPSAHSFHLKQRAEEVMQLLPEWKGRAARGEYTDHEIMVMLKFNVNPAAPFAFGLDAPQNAQALALRANVIAVSDKHQRFIEPPYDGGNDKTSSMHKSVVNQLEKMEGEE